jgi:hypothetical protein
MLVQISISLVGTSLYSFANCGFGIVFATSKLAGLRHQGHIAGQGQAMAHPKIGSQKQTLAADKVRRWCGNLPCAGCAWIIFPPLAAAIAISYQTAVLTHHLKLFSGL